MESRKLMIMEIQSTIIIIGITSVRIQMPHIFGSDRHIQKKAA